MAVGSMKSLKLRLPASQRAGARQRVLSVRAAKKGSSPWSSGGAKRGGGKGDGGTSGSGGSSSGSPPGGGSASDNAGGSAAGKKASGSGPGSGPSGGGPWKDTPTRQGLPSRPAKGGGFGAAASAGAGRLASRVAPPPPETTFTDPINVTLLDELTPTEPAAEPKWGTFCSHLSGEWVGQYAAYTPWEGKPEPAWLDERGKYINVVYTRALEQRVKETPPPPPQQQQQQQRGQQQGQGQAESEDAQGGAAGAPAASAAGAEEATESDLLMRKIGRCTKLAALPDLRLRPPQAATAGAAAAPPLGANGGGREGGAADDDEDVDVEALSFNSDGVVIFDGGNYSAGPEFIGQQEIKLVNDEAILGPSDLEGEEDEARARSGAAASTSAARSGGAKAKAAQRRGGGGSVEEEEDEEDGDEGSTLLPTSTSVFEQCLVDWGSRSRMRLKMTLRIGQLDNGEVDVEVLRILLFTEEWMGPASSERLSANPGEVRTLARPCTDLPRPTPTQLQGSWNVFTVCATGIDEVDPLSPSGEERVAWVYSSTEEQQLWDASAAPPSGDEGASFWLPGGVVLSLRMVDNYVPVDLDPDSEASDGSGFRSGANGNGNGNGIRSGKGATGERTYPRGLCVGMAWLWREGSVSLLEREYDGYGYLREVRLAQGVKGGWSGGRM